jgi:hypothetical protein
MLTLEVGFEIGLTFRSVIADRLWTKGLLNGNSGIGVMLGAIDANAMGGGGGALDPHTEVI